jgi:hypothetical protein
MTNEKISLKKTYIHTDGWRGIEYLYTIDLDKKTLTYKSVSHNWETDKVIYGEVVMI